MFSDTETVDVMFYHYERLKDHKTYRVNTLSESNLRPSQLPSHVHTIVNYVC